MAPSPTRQRRPVPVAGKATRHRGYPLSACRRKQAASACLPAQSPGARRGLPVAVHGVWHGGVDLAADAVLDASPAPTLGHIRPGGLEAYHQFPRLLSLCVASRRLNHCCLPVQCSSVRLGLTDAVPGMYPGRIHLAADTVGDSSPAGNFGLIQPDSVLVPVLLQELSIQRPSVTNS